MTKYRCFNIVWDTDGRRVRLPKEVVVEVEADLEDGELEDALSDAISDKTGWCHKGFDFEKAKD